MTDKGVAKEVLRRAGQKKWQRKKRVATITLGAATVLCLCLIAALAWEMPAFIQKNTTAPLGLDGTASVFASGSYMGYILVGIVAFLLGIVIGSLHKKNKTDDRRNEDGRIH